MPTEANRTIENRNAQTLFSDSTYKHRRSGCMSSAIQHIVLAGVLGATTLKILNEVSYALYSHTAMHTALCAAEL